MTTQDEQASVIPLDSPKVDEVKRYEKIYEFSKEMFSYSESIIKNLEDKSRNNLTAAITIMGFAFLIRKPLEIAKFQWYDLSIIGASLLSVGYIYYCHIEAVRPQGVKIPSKKQLQQLRTETQYPSGVIRSNFESLQDLYGWNLDLVKCKGDYVRQQQIYLGIILGLALIYVALSQLPVQTTSVSGMLKPTCPMISAPSRNPTPNQIRMPVLNQTMSTCTKAIQTAEKTKTIAPVIVPKTEIDGKP